MGLMMMGMAIIFLVLAAVCPDRAGMMMTIALAMQAQWLIGDALKDCVLKNGGFGDVASTIVGAAVATLTGKTGLSDEAVKQFGTKGEKGFGILGGALTGYTTYIIICAIYEATIG
jgi:hypothetical protein